MTICNISITGDRIWLLSDTVQFAGGQPWSFATKFSTFPHIMAVAGFRGLAKLHHRCDVFLNGVDTVTDVEDAAERLPARLRLWCSELREQHPGHDAAIVGQLWLCGWRPSTKGFAGWCFSSDDDFAPIELAVPSTHINPGNDHAPPPAVLSSPDILIEVAKLQKSMSAANVDAGGADMGIGGELILCQLDRQGYTIKKVHRFGDYHAIKESIRARQ